jgi:hypothetical protein
MAAQTRVDLLPNTHPDIETAVCPMCGQPLLDQVALARVEDAQEQLERETEALAQARAEQLAEELAEEARRKSARQLQHLNAQLRERNEALATHEQALAKEKKAHEQQLRDQKKGQAEREKAYEKALREQRLQVKAELAGEAERDAAAKQKRELSKRDRLIEQLREQNELQQRRIEHLNAGDRGEMNEDELLAQMQAAFPNDRIERLGRGRAGSDLLHEVRYESGDKTVVGGLIVWECKDTQAWSNGFLEQAKKQRRTHKTPHVVIVSHAFPRGDKELCVRKGVPVVAPARMVAFAQVLRELVVDLNRSGASRDGQAAKTAELYAYLGSGEFRQSFDQLAKSADELTTLLGKERTSHERTWAKRQQLYNELASHTAQIDARLRTIIERSGGGKKAKVVRLERA